MIHEVEGTKGETYLKNRLKEVLDLDTPRPPTMNMVLKRETMQQVLIPLFRQDEEIDGADMHWHGGGGRLSAPRLTMTLLLLLLGGGRLS